MQGVKKWEGSGKVGLRTGVRERVRRGGVRKCYYY